MTKKAGKTKAMLIVGIETKVKRAKPIVRRTFLSGLQYKTKPELERLLKKARVSRDGYDISLK